MMSRVSSTLSVVWVTKASRSGSLGSMPRDVLDRTDQVDPALDPPHRTLDLGMAGVTDQHDIEAVRGVPVTLFVYLGDQRTRRVDHAQSALMRRQFHALRDAVRAEYGDCALRDLMDLVDEPGALALQRLDHVLVVDDLVADVDRRAEPLQRALDDLDRPLHARAETPRLGEHHPQRGLAHPAFPHQSRSNPASCRSSKLRDVGAELKGGITISPAGMHAVIAQAPQTIQCSSVPGDPRLHGPVRQDQADASRRAGRAPLRSNPRAAPDGPRTSASAARRLNGNSISSTLYPLPLHASWTSVYL